MVAIKSSELPGLLKSGAAKFDAFLIHGADAGHIADTAKSLADALSAASSPPGEVIRLSEQDLTQTPGRLASEARSLPMFGGRPVVIVKQGPQLTPALFEELFGGPTLAAYVIVEAGNLKKDAKLRQIFEKAKQAAAIVCYAPDNRSLHQLIREELQTAGLRIETDAMHRLIQHLGGDWAVSRSEITKLMLYADGEPEITVEHVEAVVGDASAHAFDAAITAIMSGDVAVALSHIDGIAAAGTPATVLLTLLSGHLQKLHAILGAMDRGENFDSAAARMRPPLHFRQKDTMKAQTSRWRTGHVTAAIGGVHETVRQTRLKPELEHELACALVIKLAELHSRAQTRHAR